MSGPKFSVVIPCYNAAATVAETIASVQQQTCTDFEIVAVDNNSTDRTADVLDELRLSEPRLRVVKQPVQGLPAARNAGIRAARGAFIAFLDADDLFDAEYLERHAENLADGSIGLSYSRIRLVDAVGRPTGNVTSPRLDGLGAGDLLRSNPCTSMVVACREVFERAGLFDESFRRLEDQEWLFRVAAAGFAFRGIGRALASYRITPGGLSSNLDAMLLAHGQMLVAAARVAPALVAAHGRLSRGAMLRYCARRAVDHEAGAKAARGYLAQMLGVAPDLIVREPAGTLKAIAAVLVPSLARLMAARSARLQPRGA
jgi:glycosyltransferase involved in cell wall biosynthesis